MEINEAKNKIFCTDCIQGMKQLPDNSVDSIVTDPPYQLNFDFGASFKWDSTGIAFDINVWKEALRILKPGGHLLAFCGTRTIHRMTCAIEDAGFEIRDQINWVYLTGMAKGLNVDKAIDDKLGVKREVIGTAITNTTLYQKIGQKNIPGEIEITKATSELAKKWEGWSSGIKTSHEPIILARKKISESTIVDNVLKWGTGALNINVCRITCNDKRQFPEGTFPIDSSVGDIRTEVRMCDRNPDARYPSNTIIGCDCKDGKHHEKCPCTELAKSGMDPTSFFKHIKLEDCPMFIYSPKPSRGERNEGMYEDGKELNTHLTVKPIELLKYLIKLVTQPGGIVLDPFIGSGSTAVAAKYSGFNYIGFELLQEHCDIANKRLKQGTIFDAF